MTNAEQFFFDNAGFSYDPKTESERTGRLRCAQLTSHLADYCQSQNPRFDRARWLGYIAGDK